jgi:hypothetical protein
MNPVIAIGITLVIAGAYLALREDRSIRRSVVLAGEIIEVTVQSYGEGSGYSPRVRFVTINGEEREFTEPTAPASLVRLSPGKPCRILYNPRTSEARLLHFNYRFGRPWGLFAFGVAVVLMGMGMGPSFGLAWFLCASGVALALILIGAWCGETVIAWRYVKDRNVQ